MDLASDFNEFIGSLNAHGAEFLVVGAYALAFHGAPRFTGDLGLFVRPTLDNTAKVLDAVRAFGFPVEDLQPGDLTDPRRILEMGIEPVQIHVMSAISGVSRRRRGGRGPLAAAATTPSRSSDGTPFCRTSAPRPDRRIWPTSTRSNPVRAPERRYGVSRR